VRQVWEEDRHSGPPSRPGQKAAEDGQSANEPAQISEAEDSLISWVESQVEHRCPECRACLPPAAVLCVECGFHLKQKKKMSPAVRHASGDSQRTGPVFEDETGRRSHRIGSRQIVFPRWATKVILVGTLVFSAAIGFWIVREIWSAVSRPIHHARIADILMGKGTGNGGQETLANELHYVPSYIAILEEKRADSRALEHMSRLTSKLGSLPEGTDLSPLLDVAADTFAYNGVLSLLHNRTDLEWRIRASCTASGNGREMAAELLRKTIPLGRLDQASLARLAEPTEINIKKQVYEEIYETARVDAEKALCGSYQIKIEACYNDTKTQHNTSFLSNTAPVNIGCQSGTWAVELFGEQWTGDFEHLPEMRLTCPVSKTHDLLNGFKFQGLVEDGSLLVFVADGQLAAALVGVPKYGPNTIRVVDRDRMGRVTRDETRITGYHSGFESINCTPVKQAGGG